VLWPRLSERILARRQEREGQTIVALHDPAGRSIRVVGVREWAVLSCADGTRDLAGIAAAVARHGIAIAPASIASFFGEIAELGWLVDGAPRELLAGRVESAHRTPPARAVVPMPGIRIACDGSGGCCRAYATVMFLPQDVHAAEAAVAQADDDGLRFLPLHGSAPTAARAVGLRDGACAYLDADGRCRIHARAGHSAKPLGCRWYPTNVVDDGSQLRVAPVIECACAAMPVAHGDPLVPAGIDRAADLPVGIAVERVPERVAIAEGIEVERAEAFALLDRIAAVACPGDAIGWLWSLADRLERVAMQADVAAVAAMPASVL